MDFKDAAGKDAAALQARQQYLTILATERCRAEPQAAAPRPVASPKKNPKPTQIEENVPKQAPYFFGMFTHETRD